MRAPRSGAGIGDDQQFHQMVVGRERGRLDDEDILAAHVLLDLDEDLHVGEAPDGGLGERNAEMAQIASASGRLELPATTLIEEGMPGRTVSDLAGLGQHEAGSFRRALNSAMTASRPLHCNRSV
jgi:hypothetical protein